jgi:hypothetical protein
LQAVFVFTWAVGTIQSFPRAQRGNRAHRAASHARRSLDDLLQGASSLTALERRRVRGRFLRFTLGRLVVDRA